MKRIAELTRKEILELSETEVQKYIQREWMENEIPLDILSKEKKEKEQEPPLPQPSGIMYNIGNTDLLFKDEKKALGIMKEMILAGAMRASYCGFDISGYVDGKIPEDADLDIRAVRVYTREQVNEYNKKHSEWRKRINNEEEDGYPKSLIERAEGIRSDVRKIINDTIGEWVYNKRMLGLFCDCMELSDGDIEKSIAYMEKTHSFNSWTRDFLHDEWAKMQGEDSKE